MATKPKRRSDSKRVQQEALKSVAKTEQLNIRMDEANTTRLYEIAKAKRKPVGTMVREWIVEKLDSENGPLDMGRLRISKKRWSK
jgi:hypothetical protein